VLQISSHTRNTHTRLPLLRICFSPCSKPELKSPFIFVLFLFTDLGSAVRSAAVETKKASAELLLSQKDTFGSVPVNLDVSDIIAEQKNSLKATSSVVLENIMPVTQNVLTAVGGANARFLSQLGDAGNILGGNLFNLGAAASDITSKLLSRYPMLCLFVYCSTPC
jgi:hypothetical protein